MMQCGVPATLLRNAVEVAAACSIDGEDDLLDSSNNSTSPSYLKIESELRARLPRNCTAAFSPTAASEGSAAAESMFVSPRSTTSGEVAATGTMAALLESNPMMLNSGAAAGSPMRSDSGIEQAAMKLGYSGLGGKNGPGGSGGGDSSAKKMEKLKSFGGAVGGAVKTIAKDVASVGKDQLSRRLRAGSGAIPDDFDPTAMNSSSLSNLPSPPPLPPVHTLGGTLGGVNNRRSSLDTPRSGSLVAALAKCAQLRCLEYPLSEEEMLKYEAAMSAVASSTSSSASQSGSGVALRMELAAMIGGCPEEERFWQRLPASLKQLKNNLLLKNNKSETSFSSSPLSLLWSNKTELAEATERSNWHAKLSRRIFESNESLQEKRVLEFLSLGDLQAAVGFLLASPPGRSARFYRDALCTLGMAFACGLSSTTSDNTEGSGSNTSGGGSQVLDAAARTLFVQAAKIVSANAAGVGDTLLGVPLMCATGEFDDAVNILQDAGMWSYAAALAAGSLPHAARAVPLDRWATHVADAEGRLWSAVGLLVGAGLIGDAAELLVQNGLADAAAALLEAAKEEEEENVDCGGQSEKVGIKIDKKTASAVEASYESFISYVLQNI